jgi:rubrerythrin
MNITNKELLVLSAKIEGEGKDFYIALADHIHDPEVKEFLLLMAKEEANHEIQFKKLLDDKGDSQYGWENDENLRELINTHYQTDIFPQLDDVLVHLPGYQGIQKAIESALEAEKVSCEFYGLLQEACTDIESKTLLVMLEKVELEHLERVAKIRDRYLEKNFKDNPQ